MFEGVSGYFERCLDVLRDVRIPETFELSGQELCIELKK